MQNSECRILKKGLALSDPELVEGESKGFTLIELLVVMAIIGILAALALTSFNTAQKNSRDTRRKSDLQQYRNALEAYASNNNGVYPLDDAQLWGNGNINPASPNVFLDDGAGAGGALINEYLPAQIRPPVDGTCYYYLYRVDTSTRTTYVLHANLETGGIWEVCSNGQAGKIADDNANLCDMTGYTGDTTCDVP